MQEPDIWELTSGPNELTVLVQLHSRGCRVQALLLHFRLSVHRPARTRRELASEVSATSQKDFMSMANDNPTGPLYALHVVQVLTGDVSCDKDGRLYEALVASFSF